MICPQSWVGTSGVLFWVCWCWRLYTMPTSWEMQWRWLKRFLIELLSFSNAPVYFPIVPKVNMYYLCMQSLFLCHTNYHLCSQSLNDTPLLLLFTYCSLFWANPAHSISPLLFYKYVLIRSSTYIHVYLNSCTVYNSVKWFGENIEEICLGLATSGSGIMWQ